MCDMQTKVDRAAEFLETRFGSGIRLGVLSGTGLGAVPDTLEDRRTLSYEEIPHFPRTTVQSHAGRLVVGRWQGAAVMALQGRFHLYEGYSSAQVAFPVRVMQALGIEVLMLLNAAGGINDRFRPGDIMLIGDHINLTGQNPLVGPEGELWGDRFPDMAFAYDRELRALARRRAAGLGITLQEGVYAGLLGPSLETPAEVRFLKRAGADAVVFSTVQETIAAVQAGMRVVGLSAITNVHDPDHPAAAEVDAIIETADRTAPQMALLCEKLAGVLHGA